MSIIDERLKQIAELEETIEEKIERIEEKKTEIEEKKTLVGEKGTAIESKKTWIEEKKQELEEQTAIVDSVPDDLLEMMSRSSSRSTEKRGIGDTVWLTRG